MAGTQRVHAAEYRGEYNVPVQAVVRGTAVGTEARHATRRGAGEMRGPQSHDAIGDARDHTDRMIRDLPTTNYI